MSIGYFHRTDRWMFHEMFKTYSILTNTGLNKNNRIINQ